MLVSIILVLSPSSKNLVEKIILYSFFPVPFMLIVHFLKQDTIDLLWIIVICTFALLKVMIVFSQDMDMKTFHWVVVLVFHIGV